MGVEGLGLTTIRLRTPKKTKDNHPHIARTRSNVCYLRSYANDNLGSVAQEARCCRKADGCLSTSVLDSSALKHSLNQKPRIPKEHHRTPYATCTHQFKNKQRHIKRHRISRWPGRPMVSGVVVAAWPKMICKSLVCESLLPPLLGLRLPSWAHK